MLLLSWDHSFAEAKGKVRAVVLLVTHEEVVLSLGRNDGVKPKMEGKVFIEKQLAGRSVKSYIAELVIEEVIEDQSKARIRRSSDEIKPGYLVEMEGLAVSGVGTTLPDKSKKRRSVERSYTTPGDAVQEPRPDGESKPKNMQKKASSASQKNVQPSSVSHAELTPSTPDKSLSPQHQDRRATARPLQTPSESNTKDQEREVKGREETSVSSIDAPSRPGFSQEERRKEELKRAAAYLDVAKVFEKEKDYGRALENYQDVLNIIPDDGEARKSIERCGTIIEEAQKLREAAMKAKAEKQQANEARSRMEFVKNAVKTKIRAPEFYQQASEIERRASLEHNARNYEAARKLFNEAITLYEKSQYVILPTGFMARGNGLDPHSNLPLELTCVKDGMEMRLAPAGDFLMGSNTGHDDEIPQHKVYLDNFYVDEHEVTNAQYTKFLNEVNRDRDVRGNRYLDLDSDSCQIERVGGEYAPKRRYEDYPAVEITWFGANAYARWAGKRLPTEAEWEKAARGTDGRKYPWGNSSPDESGLRRANYRTSFDGYSSGSPVGSYAAGVSPYGCYDMAGNAWEWCADWYDDRYYLETPTSNPGGPTDGVKRVIRGGSWASWTNYLRCSYRCGNLPFNSSGALGFRCAKTIP